MNKYTFDCHDMVPMKELPGFTKPKMGGLLMSSLGKSMEEAYDKPYPTNEMEITVKAQDEDEAEKKVNELIKREEYVLIRIEYCD